MKIEYLKNKCPLSKEELNTINRGMNKNELALAAVYPEPDKP